MLGHTNKHHILLASYLSQQHMIWNEKGGGGGERGQHLLDVCPLVTNLLGVSIRAIGGDKFALRIHEVEVARRDIIADGRGSI